RAAMIAGSVLALGAAGAAAQESVGGASPEDQAAAAADTTATTSAAGYDVKALQRKLGVTADGHMGPQTRRALKRFQKRNGLTADGVVGPATLEALGLPTAREASVPEEDGEDGGSSGSGTAPTALLQRIAQCESGGDPTAVSPDGRYRGKYQFLRSTWKGLGGSGDPAAAPEAEQDRRALQLLKTQGPGAWPVCSKA
ncbi:MAG TPA: transglycosylase family protein, partial [Solirubrobacteraceae bacterium]|nr:transglycosylase family protein [Solirubrobacteraceae bacterium]